MLGALRKRKPDCVLLSEVFGPVFYSVCNLVHDNQTEAATVVLEKMAAGEIDASHYEAHIANVFDALPRGANRVFFARNHDTSWFYHFDGYTPRFLALDALHALVGIPEVFAGDPRNGPNPDSDPAVYEYYRRLFALRKEFPELTRGELRLRDTEDDNPWIVSGIRRLDDRDVVFFVSLSDKPEPVRARILDGEGIPRRIEMLELRDAHSDSIVRTRPVESFDPEEARFELTLEPFQILVGRCP
jgi:hypothetical protein